eukprot:6212963-Pleurochrysis_carterae.AAC.3
MGSQSIAGKHRMCSAHNTQTEFSRRYSLPLLARTLRRSLPSLDLTMLARLPTPSEVLPPLPLTLLKATAQKQQEETKQCSPLLGSHHQRLHRLEGGVNALPAPRKIAYYARFPAPLSSTVPTHQSALCFAPLYCHFRSGINL